MQFTIRFFSRRCGQSVKAPNDSRVAETNHPPCLKPVLLRESRPAGFLAALLLPLLVLLTACGSKESVKSLKKKAEAGDAQAQFELGRKYYDRGVAPKNYMEAVIKYYKSGGISKDEVEAVKWFRKAAEQGHAQAQRYLGVAYANGWGASKDEVEAVKWTRKAAEQGHPIAQNNLGLMYDKGEGVPENDVEAVKWFREFFRRLLSRSCERVCRVAISPWLDVC